MTTRYHGQTDVARWCGGISPSVISNWISRYPELVPAPDAETTNEDSSTLIRGWLAERRPEWEAFAAARKRVLPRGPAAAARVRKNRTAAAMVYQDMQDGKIDPATAAKLLHELI